MPRIFISYKRADRPFLKRLLSLLQIVRDNNIWHDEQIAGGESWWEKILREIAECDVFIYLLSNDSLKSPYCLAEFAEAVRLNKIIIPVVCRLQTEIPKRFPKSVSDPQTLKAILRKTQWITLINSDGEIDTAAFISLNETIRISKSEKTQSPQTPDPTPMPPVDDKTFLGKILSTQAWVSIVIIVAIIGIIVQILNAPSPIITTPLPTENILATQSPTMTPIPLYLFERDNPNPVGDIWKILRDDSRGNYEVGQNLVVYRADVINPANGNPSEIPIAMVRVINKTETQLFVQVILKHVNAQYQIRTGDRINGNLDSLNTNDLIPAFSEASGYFLSIDGEPVVYLVPGISLSVGTILKVLKPSIRDQQIIDYFITETQIEVTGLGQAKVLAQVRLLDGATQMPENGTLVIFSNPPTDQGVTLPVSPNPTLTSTEISSFTPTASITPSVTPTLSPTISPSDTLTASFAPTISISPSFPFLTTPTISVVSTSIFGNTSLPCTSTQEVYLSIEEHGIIDTDSGHQNIRATPGITEFVFSKLPKGEKFVVIDGPICVDNLNWFFVRFSERNLEGWIAETDGINYLVATFTPTFDSFTPPLSCRHAYTNGYSVTINERSIANNQVFLMYKTYDNYKNQQALSTSIGNGWTLEVTRADVCYGLTPLYQVKIVGSDQTGSYNGEIVWVDRENFLDGNPNTG